MKIKVLEGADASAIGEVFKESYAAEQCRSLACRYDNNGWDVGNGRRLGSNEDHHFGELDGLENILAMELEED